MGHPIERLVYPHIIKGEYSEYERSGYSLWCPCRGGDDPSSLDFLDAKFDDLLYGWLRSAKDTSVFALAVADKILFLALRVDDCIHQHARLKNTVFFSDYWSVGLKCNGVPHHTCGLAHDCELFKAFFDEHLMRIMEILDRDPEEMGLALGNRVLHIAARIRHEDAEKAREGPESKLALATIVTYGYAPEEAAGEIAARRSVWAEEKAKNKAWVQANATP